MLTQEQQESIKQNNDILNGYTLNISAKLDTSKTELNDDGHDTATLTIKINDASIQLLKSVMCDTNENDFISEMTSLKNVERYLLKRAVLNSRMYSKTWCLFFSKEIHENNGVLKITTTSTSYVDEYVNIIKDAWRNLVKALIQINELSNGKNYSVTIKEIKTSEKVIL